VAIDGGRIVEVLPADAATGRYRGREVVHLARHAVTPGFVNAHTHAAMTLLRGVGDDLPLMRWLTERIWPLEKALVSPEFVYDGGRLAALEMLRSGTTCASDMYFYPDASVRAFRALGMRFVAGIIAIEFPTAYASDAEDYLRKGLAVRDELRNDPLVSFTLAPHAPYTVSDATLQRIAMLADELDLPVHTHVHETDDEIRQSIARHGCRPLARLDRLGLVSERLIAVHAVHLDDAELGRLAERGASIAHCPASNLKLGSGIAPIARAAAAGINLALGTDGAASNNRVDMLSELRLAALLAKGAAGDASVLAAPAILDAATLGGARALGLQDRIGSIEAGKEADLVAFDLAPPETQPLYDVISHLVYSTGREQVTDAWVGGQRVVEERQVLPASAHADLMPRVGAWQNRCRQVLLTAGAS
ncbi:MAG TPA: TRZ/ATZ family hydrolase, partial [Burkholderiaceae bacterium]|nr:TRZ/ATZ family hydrolase [Burkholderiaceae bacterium]